MDDLSFLDQLLSADYGENNAILKVVLPDGHVDYITDRISPYRLLDNCPLLYHAFEFGHQSRLQASIEASSRTAVIALLRYCYTNNYLPPDAEYTPIMFLPHAQVYKMSEDFDIPELQLMAHGNFACQVDFACSLPEPPRDLLDTIRYIYIYFASPESRQQQGLLHTLLNYCISVFQYHKLGESTEFLEIVREIPDFRQDLCRTNMARNFQDDCALEIIQLALDTLQPQPSPRPTLLASRDLPQEMLIDRPASPARTGIFDPVHDAVRTMQDEGYSHEEDSLSDSIVTILDQNGPSTLAFRPKEPQPIVSNGFEADSSSEDEGFMMVHRPRTPSRTAPEVLPTSSYRPSTPAATSSQPQPRENHALEDYQMQLMLLEQQNKKRLLLARQEQDAMLMNQPMRITNPDNVPAWPVQQYNNLQDQQTIPMQLEQASMRCCIDMQQAQHELPTDISGDMSSPEIIPPNPEQKTADVMALAGSDYSDDEDWTML